MKSLCLTVHIVVCVFTISICNGLLIREQFQCKPGTPYKENECNECHCLKADDLVCAIQECPDNKDKGLENCPTGISWYKDNGCNKCWCVNIGTLCTNHNCDSKTDINHQNF